MNVFDLRDHHRDYDNYTRSFINIKDPHIQRAADSALDGGLFWPEPLLQLNPTFLKEGTIDELVRGGMLRAECSKISRVEKSDRDPIGEPLMLHMQRQSRRNPDPHSKRRNPCPA